MKKFKLFAVIFVIGLFLAGCTANNETKVQGQGTTQSKTVLDNVIATTTSSAISIQGAKRVTLFIDNTPSASGYATTTYAVTVSTDGTNFVTYNKLIDNVTNTNSQTLTRVASKNSSTDENLLLSMDLGHDVFKSFKVSATIAWLTGTTISTSSVSALIDY